MQWLLRGRSWPALAPEIAWAAVSATREPPETMDWLVPLVDEHLAERLDDVRAQAGAAVEAARDDYARRWPNDVGAETAAELAGREAAEHALGRIYFGTVRWAATLLLERRAANERRSILGRLGLRRASATPVVGEFPEFVVHRAARPEAVGWPDRAAA